ncbi:unnamed protein product [Polarella glacialis]|uniref:Uncharacterized protein n=1 Tax=Polarella glacialis TaxID=89957 RepID=A0A813ENV3_POLGL|nr:unnamed protein product [Polarella glacialis]
MAAKDARRRLEEAFSSTDADKKTRKAESASPLKEKLAKLQKMAQETKSPDDTTAPNSGGPSSSSDSGVLSGLHEISQKMDKRSLTSDLDDLKQSFADQAKVLISEAIDPMQIAMREVQEHVGNLESSRNNNPTSSSSKEVTSLRASLNKLDPALRRVAFLDWPDSVCADVRLKEIETFISSNCASCRPAHIDHFYKGPSGERVPSGVSYAEFRSPDDQYKFLKLTRQLTFNVAGKADLCF